MGFLDSIKHAASSVGSKVTNGLHDAKRAASDLARKVHDAPSKLARGATQALHGVRQLGAKVAAKAAPVVRQAKAGLDTLRRGAKDIKDAVAPKLAAAGRAIGHGASVAGKWAWDHKAEIGFWVGTTALMLAVPVSGGASGALAGGLMAARAASVGVKVAQMGRAGVGAVKLAKGAATAVQGVKGAMAATRAGGAIAKGGQALHAGRVALGGTKVGKAMLAAQKPVTAASTIIAGANFGDTAVKYGKGEAGAKDLALATLGFAPAGVGGVKGLAARRAAKANEQAASLVRDRIERVAVDADGASRYAAHAATVAPTVNAPRTAGAAAAARDRAVGTADKAADLRDKVVMTARSGATDDAISASRLRDELDEVASRADAARAPAAEAVELAPATLSPVVRVADAKLEAAKVVATQARRDISALAEAQRKADKVAGGAERVQDTLGTAGLHAGLVNNGVKSMQEQRGQGFSLTDGSLVRGLATWMLGRNARVNAPVTTPAPAPPAAAPAR